MLSVEQGEANWKDKMKYKNDCEYIQTIILWLVKKHMLKFIQLSEKSVRSHCVFWKYVSILLAGAIQI